MKTPHERDAGSEERVAVATTKRGKLVARHAPPDDEHPPLFGSGPITSFGDIIGPVDEDWELQH